MTVDEDGDDALNPYGYDLIDPRKGGTDEVREPGRPGVLELTLADDGLHELEVRETRQAVAAAEGEADRELRREKREQPPPAEGDRAGREDADDGLVEPRRPRVDHVQVAVRIGEPLRVPLHFGKYRRAGAS